MRLLKVLSWTMLVLSISNVSVVAEDKSPQSGATPPSLGNIMATVQLRHAKLWYAVNLKNWLLADYELGQLKADLKEATRLYPNISAWDMTGIDKATALLGEAIKAKEGGKFDQAFRQMTAACNTCHEATGRAFIFMRVPTRPTPFSNQMFAPREK